MKVKQILKINYNTLGRSYISAAKLELHSLTYFREDIKFADLADI